MEVPLRYIFPKGDVLDYGCGRGQTADSEGWDKFDPNWHPIPILKTYDTVLCTYVANVILDNEERDRLYNSLKFYTKGKAYLTVRTNEPNTETQLYDLDKEILENGFKLVNKKSKFSTYLWEKKEDEETRI